MARRKKEKKSVVMPYLPDDLIIQILVRLPVKSLLRFRCVSKFFCSLISNPRFAISHFDLAASNHRLLYLPCYPYDYRPRSIDLDSSSTLLRASAPLNLDYLPAMSSHLIKGSCRGFILLYNMKLGGFLVIWNPSTRAYRQLPSTHLFLPDFFGFGYDASTDDYLVVLGSRYLRGDIRWKPVFRLFSLRANAWKTIEVTHLPYETSSAAGRGVLLNGVIHWLTYRSDIDVNVILAFDFTEKSFSELPLPPDIDVVNNKIDPWGLCVLGGSLSLYVPGDNGATDIWVMKEYKVLSSWSKSVTLVMPFEVKYRNDFIPLDADILPNQCSFEQFFPICSTKSGDIVGTNGDIRVVKFNAKGLLLDHRSFLNDPCGCEVVMYTESLFSFPLN